MCKPVPIKVSLQLHTFKYLLKFNEKFNHCSAIGKLSRSNFKNGYSLHDTSITKYFSDNSEELGEAVIYVIKNFIQDT